VRDLGAGATSRCTARSSVRNDHVAVPSRLRSGGRWASATTCARVAASYVTFGPRPGALVRVASPRALKRFTSARTALPPA